MAFTELCAQAVHGTIINGCYRLIEQRQELNQINVFPVADGDTGDNMSAVCSSIVEFSEVKENPKNTLRSIAQAAILGSRGNSGILLTQFFIGLHQNLPASNSLSFKDFCAAFKKISEEIHSVLSKPVEGTIITLIKKLSEFANKITNEVSMTRAMKTIIPQLKEEVQKTASSLKILEKSKVVDAGALGFYYFIEGFTNFLEQGIQRTSSPSYAIHATENHEHDLTEPPTFRYCTEAILKNPSISQHSLLMELAQQGDCAAVVGTKELLKIHLHTNKPEQLFSTLYDLGEIKYPKVDDMQRQYQMQSAKKHSIAIVTDSGADLPQALLDHYQIHTLALNIHIGEHDVLDKHSFEPHVFYNQLQTLSTYPKTSCIPPHKVNAYLTRLRAHYENVLILSISSTMSGMHDAFVEAAKEDSHITVLDTKTNSAAHGLLLEYTGKLIADNLPFQEIVQKITTAIKTTCMFVLVNQFDSMMRSGRMNKLSARLASWSHIKPIVSIDETGRGVIAGKSLSSGKGLHKLILLVQKQLQQKNALLEEYCIVHADNHQDAQELAKLSTAYFSKPPLFIDSVSLAVGLHAGKGCVALAARLAV